MTYLRNSRLIIALWKFDVVKRNICPTSKTFRANMQVLRHQILYIQTDILAPARLSLSVQYGRMATEQHVDRKFTFLFLTNLPVHVLIFGLFKTNINIIT